MLIQNLSLTIMCRRDRGASPYTTQCGKTDKTGTLLLSQTASLCRLVNDAGPAMARHLTDAERTLQNSRGCLRFKLLGLLTLSKADRN